MLKLRDLASVIPFDWGRPRAPLRVLVTADRIQATQIISFERPLRRLTKSRECALRMIDEARLLALGEEGIDRLWRLFDPNVLILSRASGRQYALLGQRARTAGVPLVFHLDDDLLAVPRDLGESKYRYYNDPARLERLRQGLSGADLIYASTAELGARLQGHGVSSEIVSGRIYCATETPIPAPSRSKGGSRTIGYMGTAGHGGDLAPVLPAVEQVLEQDPNIRFETFGSIKPPKSLEKFGKRIRHHRPVKDYDRFVSHLGTLGWDIGLAPLCDTAFNRCKADTKWVEYTAAGIATIASRGLVYARCCADGAGLLAGPDDWQGQLSRLLSVPGEIEKTWHSARARAEKNYGFEMLEAQLLEVLARVGTSREAYEVSRDEPATTSSQAKANVVGAQSGHAGRGLLKD